MPNLDLTNWRVHLAAALIGLLLGAGGTVAIDIPDEQTAAKLRDHETRLRTLEAVTTNVAADVRWIRQRLAKSEQ